MQKPTSYISQSTDQYCRSTGWSQHDKKTFLERFVHAMVLIFIDIATVALTSTEKLVKNVKNLLKKLQLLFTFYNLFTLIKITQSFRYGGSFVYNLI